MLEQGQTFAHFKIVRRLGVGGMGEVYLAEDQKLGRNVALKILQRDFFGNPERLERFRREAQTAAKINHQNVMAIYDIGVTPDASESSEINYIVMEYVAGDELSDYLRDRNPNMIGRVRLAEKIASGLAAAHRLNIVHRDIKAENIIVNEDGEPKILDFGLAKPLEPVFSEDDNGETDTISRELTKAGKIMGTVTYMSPEQARGDEIDVRSDIFSFGILLYQMATGVVPFAGKTQMSVLAKILETKQEPPSTINAEIPAELERIINKCLHKEPSDRYQDTRDLVVDLRNLRRIYDSGVTDTVSSVTTDAVKPKVFMLRGVRLWAVLAVIVAAVLLNWRTGIFDFGGDKNQTLQAQENSLAILGFDNKTGDKKYDWLETGLPEILLTDLGQTGALHLIGHERVLDYFKDRKAQHSHDDYVKAAKSLGAVRTLSGTIFKFGDKIRIDARLEDIASGSMIMAEKVVGNDPFPLIDSLINKIGVSLNMTDKMLSSSDRARLTSTSSEAYRLYHEGQDLMFKGFDDEAIDRFREALAIDSGFALPYMRIGMVNFFRGRVAEGKPYLAEAVKRRDALPIRDQLLLDVYAEIWLDQSYGDAFTMMRSFVTHYPDDKEGRTIYSILVWQFQRDTTTAMALLDTVLAQDPTYGFAIEQYSSLCYQAGQMDKAIDLARRLTTAEPDSPSGWMNLAGMYADSGDLKKSIDVYKEVLDKFPNRSIQRSALPRLVELYIALRDFESANNYNERFRAQSEDDPYQLRNYYHQKANLLNWEGKLAAGIEARHEALKYGLTTKDSTLIYTDLTSVSNYFDRYGMTDSCRYYDRLAAEWAPTILRVNYYLHMVNQDNPDCEGIKSGMAKAVDEFRSRVPKDFWDVLDPLQAVFEARCAHDTTAMIAALRGLCNSRGGGASGNKRDLAYLLILTDGPAEGLAILDSITGGPGQEETVAYRHLYESYLHGVAYQKLGEDEKAAKSYAEVLKYWDKADLQIEPIEKSRENLARLTG